MRVLQVWSPFPQRNGSGDIDAALGAGVTERPVYTHEEYINLVLRSGLVMSHDYSSQSVEEDPRMMAFFDSLVQRELEYWSSDEDMSSNEIELYDSILQVTRHPQHQANGGNENEAAQQEREGHSSDSSDNSDFSPFTLAFASVMAAQETDASRVLDAHEESERLRVAVQEPLELGHGRSSGRSSRKSISEIIAQNRKEVMRAAELRHRNIRSSIDLHANILSSMSSESDSDEQAAGPSTRDGVDVGRVLNKRSAQQQRAAYQLKRLQALRTRLVTSDTDNSGDDTPPYRKRIRLASNSSQEEGLTKGKGDGETGAKAVVGDKSSAHTKSVDCGASTSQVTCSSSHLLSSVVKGKTAFEHEAGPYLQHADGPGPSTHLPALPSSSHSEPVASTSGTSASAHNRNSGDSVNRDASSHSNASSARNSGDCVSRDGSSHSSANNRNSGDSVNRDGSSHSNAAAAAFEGGNRSDAEGAQPVWNEFKKFKKRLERAKRYYRQKTNVNNNESSDDD